MILIDEFSTGIDAKMKRDMWGTLRNVAVGKAIVITTREPSWCCSYYNRLHFASRRLDGGSVGASEQGRDSRQEDAR